MTAPQSPTNGASPIAQRLALLHVQQHQSSAPGTSPSKKVRFAWTSCSGKTAWDWLQFLVQLLGALAIPLVIAFATNTLTTQQQRTADAQHQNDLALADDQQKEATLKVYLDDMTNLLLNNHLHNSAPTDEVRNVARIKTLTTLRRLDGTRKGILLQFLYEADLIDPTVRIVDLLGADLRGADLRGAFLVGADLLGADLSYANLRGAFLHDARLDGADLRGADLRGAGLGGADLDEADLRGAFLVGAFLDEADLSYANLRRTAVTPAQLATTRSLEGTTMPDGSRHP